MSTEKEKIEALTAVPVNGTQKAWRFYNNEIYDEGYKSQYDLFSDIKEMFNPVPKIAFIMNALTVQKHLEIEIIGSGKKEEKEKDIITGIWEYNKFQKMKYILVLWLILTKKAYIELSRKTDSVTGEKVIVFTLLDHENVEEIKKVGNEIVYARLKGEAERFNRDTKEFETIGVTKEYYNVDGYNALIETYSGNSAFGGNTEERVAEAEGAEVDEENKVTIPLTWGFVPIVEFDTDYDITPLFNKIDSYNQIEAYLDNIFYLHGDPLIWDNNTDGQLDESTAKEVSNARFKQQVMLHLPVDGKMQYLEMQGNVAKLMLEKQGKILEMIQNDYPEYMLAAILSKGDPSGDALEVKATEVVTKVESLRGDVEEGVITMDNMALQMLGHTPVKHKLIFADILPKSLKELVDMLTDLRGTNMVTRKTFMKKVPDIYPDPEQEIKELDEEAEQKRKDFASEYRNINNNLSSMPSNNSPPDNEEL